MKLLGNTPPGNPATALIRVEGTIRPVHEYFYLTKMWSVEWYYWLRCYDAVMEYRIKMGMDFPLSLGVKSNG
jgi:hypothetical protein